MSIQLKVYKCQECDMNSLFAPIYCPNCREKNSFVQTDIDGTGEILTYTVVHVSEQRFNSETPYPLAIIELNGNLRILGRIRSNDVSLLQIGKKVTLSEYRENIPVFNIQA